MAINPLQAHVTTLVSPENGATGKAGAGSSAFGTLLSSLESAEGRPAARPQLAAAELLRMEMMQNSLSLFAEAGGAPPSGLQALESLLSCVAGKNHGNLAATARSGLAGGASSLQAAGAADALGYDAAVSDAAGNGDEIDQIGKTAADFLGTPYRFGGEGPEGIDCSSFVQQVFQEHQIVLPRTAREQIKVGREVAAGELKKGDLVFFQTYASYPSHVGIYLGDGKMIHASSGKGEVTVSDMDSDYYRSRFLGAKRVA